MYVFRQRQSGRCAAAAVMSRTMRDVNSCRKSSNWSFFTGARRGGRPPAEAEQKVGPSRNAPVEQPADCSTTLLAINREPVA